VAAINAPIDLKDLGKSYAELDWKYEGEPALDEPAREALGGSFPAGPCWWKDGVGIMRLGDEGARPEE
jgi:hypothetical protein